MNEYEVIYTYKRHKKATPYILTVQAQTNEDAARIARDRLLALGAGDNNLPVFIKSVIRLPA